MSKKGMKYDYKKAHDKNLPMSERFHYLENARHDQDAGSPATFMGGIAGAAARGLSTGANPGIMTQRYGIFGKPAAPTAPTVDMSAGPTQAQQAAAASVAAGGTMATPDQNPMTGGAMNQANPFEGKTFQITPANMMGNAKPLFSDQTQGMAQTAFGSGLERQMSMPNSGSVTQMSAKQEKAFGPGSKVYEGGNTAIYEGLKAEDSSPTPYHEGVSHKYSLNAENYADSVRVAKREQRFNEMMKPKMTRTITNMPYTEEQLKARNESIKKSEAQELPRIKRK